MESGSMAGTEGDPAASPSVTESGPSRVEAGAGRARKAVAPFRSGLAAGFSPPLVIALVLAALAAMGVLLYRTGTRLVEDATRNRLEAVATLKASLIQACIDDSMDDFLIWVGSPDVRHVLGDWHSGGIAPDEARLELATHLEQRSKTYRFRAITLRDAASGAPLLDTPGAIAVSPSRARMLAAATDDVFEADAALAIAGEFKPQHAEDRGIALSAFTRIVLGDGTPLVVQIDIDPLHQVSRVLESWPGTDDSGEVELMRAEPDRAHVTVLQGSTAREDALHLHVAPADSQGAVARRVLDAPHGGFLQGLDERGRQAYAFARPVAGTDWILVAMLERAEVLRELNRIALLTATATGAVLLLCAWWLIERRTRRRLETRMQSDRIEHAERLAQESRGIVKVQEQERQRLAMELHDRTAANLAAIQMNLKAIARLVPGDRKGDLALLGDTGELLADSVVSIREFCDVLHPPVLDYAGAATAIAASVAQFGRRTGIDARFVNGGYSARASQEVESALFRIAQEALANVAKHAGADQVRVRIDQDSEAITLTVEDNGVGFDPARPRPRDGPGGHGLWNMRERAVVAGGELTIHSRAGQGTRIRFVIFRVS